MWQFEDLSTCLNIIHGGLIIFKFSNQHIIKSVAAHQKKSPAKL